MGTYYQVACDQHKERIDPGDINNKGIKAHAIAHPNHEFGPVVIFAMLRRWNAPIRLADDTREDEGYFDYKNVTQQVIADYNEVYGTSLEYTGKADE